jgi:hypothetical protein
MRMVSPAADNCGGKPNSANASGNEAKVSLIQPPTVVSIIGEVGLSGDATGIRGRLDDLGSDGEDVAWLRIV